MCSVIIIFFLVEICWFPLKTHGKQMQMQGKTHGKQMKMSGMDSGGKWNVCAEVVAGYVEADAG